MLYLALPKLEKMAPLSLIPAIIVVGLFIGVMTGLYYLAFKWRKMYPGLDSTRRRQSYRGNSFEMGPIQFRTRTPSSKQIIYLIKNKLTKSIVYTESIGAPSTELPPYRSTTSLVEDIQIAYPEAAHFWA